MLSYNYELIRKSDSAKCTQVRAIRFAFPPVLHHVGRELISATAVNQN